MYWSYIYLGHKYNVYIILIGHIYIYIYIYGTSEYKRNVHFSDRAEFDFLHSNIEIKPNDARSAKRVWGQSFN